MTKEQWVHGLIAAFLGGLAGAVDGGLTVMLIAPETFNLGPGLRKTLLTLTVFGILSGVKLAAAYLKQSPIWSEQSVTETHSTGVIGDRVVQRDIVETVKSSPAPNPPGPTVP
jgi:gas vesicle protein